MKKDQRKQLQMEQQMSFRTKVVLIGLFGGLFWSLLWYGAFYFNFTRVGPALILMPWSLGEWKDTVLGQWVGILVIAILSIGVAFVYKLCFQKLKSMWIGAGYGLLLWILVFYILNPLFPGLKQVHHLDSNTIVTSLCLFVLYGLFIGYSISFEHAEQEHDKRKSQSEQAPN